MSHGPLHEKIDANWVFHRGCDGPSLWTNTALPERLAQGGIFGQASVVNAQYSSKSSSYAQDSELHEFFANFAKVLSKDDFG
jgi:hypothetical protein